MLTWLRASTVGFALLLAGCSSIISGNSSDNVAIQDHFITGGGYSSVLSQANSYCRQFGARAVLKNKTDGCLLLCGSEYNYYNFSCVKEPSSFVPTSSNVPRAESSLPIDDAKNKCMDLGFKVGTEGFGKCVLQLTK